MRPFETKKAKRNKNYFIILESNAGQRKTRLSKKRRKDRNQTNPNNNSKHPQVVKIRTPAGKRQRSECAQVHISIPTPTAMLSNLIFFVLAIVTLPSIDISSQLLCFLGGEPSRGAEATAIKRKTRFSFFYSLFFIQEKRKRKTFSH